MELRWLNGLRPAASHAHGDFAWFHHVRCPNLWVLWPGGRNTQNAAIFSHTCSHKIPERPSCLRPSLSYQNQTRRDTLLVIDGNWTKHNKAILEHSPFIHDLPIQQILNCSFSVANCLSLPKADSFWGVDLIVFILFSISILEARTLDFLDWIWQFYANLHFSHAEQMHKPPFLISSYIYCQFNIAKPPIFLQVKPPLASSPEQFEASSLATSSSLSLSLSSLLPSSGVAGRWGCTSDVWDVQIQRSKKQRACNTPTRWCAYLSLFDIQISVYVCLIRFMLWVFPLEAMSVFDIYDLLVQESPEKRSTDAFKMWVSQTPIKQEIAGIRKQRGAELQTAISTKSTLNGFKDVQRLCKEFGKFDGCINMQKQSYISSFLLKQHYCSSWKNTIQYNQYIQFDFQSIKQLENPPQWLENSQRCITVHNESRRSCLVETVETSPKMSLRRCKSLIVMEYVYKWKHLIQHDTTIYIQIWDDNNDNTTDHHWQPFHSFEIDMGWYGSFRETGNK